MTSGNPSDVPSAPDLSAAIERDIAEWRTSAHRRGQGVAPDVEVREAELRRQVADLQRAGLDEAEAFLIGLKRIGEKDPDSHTFARRYAERLWIGTSTELIARSGAGGRDVVVALVLAIAAGISIKVPELFGVRIAAEDGLGVFYARNFSFFVLPFLVLFFGWKRRTKPKVMTSVGVTFLLGAMAINLLPFTPGGATELLAILHLPMGLWLAVGIVHSGGAWRSHDARMDYIRFSGEWFIYYCLIALGGGVLILCTGIVFSAIGVDIGLVIGSWILPCGVVGAVVIAGWLADAKQSVIENMAPVLTLIFTPLFALMLLAFLVTMLLTGSGIDVGREALIGFDLLLVVVTGLLVYSISARDPDKDPGIFDILQLALVVAALAVDGMALWSILARISEYGFTPNRVAALGENLILVVNLSGCALLSARFVSGRATFAPLERWQTAYVPVYALWASIVVLVFPIAFRFI